MGLGDQLVGRTSSNTNPSIASLPLVTSNGHERNAEAILALAPTVILADSTLGPPEVLEQLRSAGIDLVMFTPDRTMDGIRPMITDAAGEAGITGTKPANAEALAALDPDVILVMSAGLESTGGLDGLLERPGVAQTTAGQKRRVVDVPDGQLLSFGPNSAAALLAIAEAVYAPAPARSTPRALRAAPWPGAAVHGPPAPCCPSCSPACSWSPPRTASSPRRPATCSARCGAP
ncbi:heme/hemin ABC transporter substrate-binding protein [Zafaria sp. Z1313]|uniref:heme/hemin ABC transporter substrate-binding protein n=1 Tax=Zafaria sp. Z1313 TaxID=3423202 RepID=UPI003D302623